MPGLPASAKFHGHELFQSTLASTLLTVNSLQPPMQAVMDVHVMVLESDGSHVGAATTAASTALADASCELFDLVPACHVVGVEGAGRS